MKHLYLILTISVVIPFSMMSQTLHFVPPYIYDVNSGQEVLKIKINDNVIKKIEISNGQFTISNLGNTTRSFELKNKTISALVDEIDDSDLVNKPEFTIFGGFSELPADKLKNVNLFVTLNSEVNLTSSSANPTFLADFGIVYSTTQNSKELLNNSLLNEAGFQLNLLGHHKFGAGKNTCSYFSYRIGLASNIGLIVNETTDTNNNVSNIFESVIKQANQGVLSSQVEWVVSKKDNYFQWSFFLEGGISFNRMAQYDVNSIIRLNETNSFRLIDSFSSNAIENFKLQSTRAMPVGFLELGTNFKYISENKLLFYGGIGIMQRPTIARGIKFKFEDHKIQDHDFLEYVIRDAGINYSIRPKIGFRISESIDLRAEAIYIVDEKLNIDRNNRNNLFRILITKDFNLTK